MPDVCIVEVCGQYLPSYNFFTPSLKLGGTVGDIESAPFVEAMRQFQFRVGHDNFALIHVSLVPDMHGEQKTKPTQTTVHSLRGLGLLPDLVRPILPVVLEMTEPHPNQKIACRLLIPQPLNAATKAKISMFCHVAPEQVLGIHDMSSVYHVPLLLQSQGIVEYLDKRLKLGVLNGGSGEGQVKVNEDMKKKGRDLEGRWKDMTTR